jgi:hypothetical protein
VGINTKSFIEVFAVANMLGKPIVIPHTRRAAEYGKELTNK